MKPTSEREEALFQNAVQLTGAERAAFLDDACHGDAALRQRLEALLAAHAAEDSLLADPPAVKSRATINLDLALEETPGTIIGRYELLQKIGEGGMGVVYMAEQTEPVVRKVALKIIKLGMDNHVARRYRSRA